MKAAGLALCAVTAFAGTAYGQVQSIANFTQLEQPRTYDVRSGQWVVQSPLAGRAFPTIYSNVATPTAAGVQHNVADEIVGDDVSPVNLNVNPGSNGTVHEVTISIANFGANIVNQSLSLDIVFFRNDAIGVAGQSTAGTEFGRLTTNLANFNLSAASFGLFNLTGLQSLPNPVQVSSGTFWVGVKFNTIGSTVTTTDLGQVFYGPITEGFSSDLTYFRDSTTSNPIFSAGFTNNFGLQILVPTPGALAVLGMGGLVGLRRRRS